MSRKKKVKSAGNADIVIVRQRSENDVEGRSLKKSKKRKGLKSGNRHSSGSETSGQKQTVTRDPRLGSKKKVPLTVAPKAVPSKADRLVLAEQELAQIESDAQFNVLLARLENGEKLGAGLQAYVDQKLDRVEVLMKTLGLDTDDYEDDDALEAQNQEDMNPVKVVKSSKKTRDDDDLLSDFEDLNLDEWKG
jgi:uncharacterized protein